MTIIDIIKGVMNYPGTAALAKEERSEESED